MTKRTDNRQNKQVRVLVKLQPLVEELAKEKGYTFSQATNFLVEQGLRSQETEVTPNAIRRVMAGFNTEDLIDLLISFANLVKAREIQGSDEDKEIAIAILSKMISGEKLTIPDLSRAAGLTDTSLEEVKEAVRERRSNAHAD